MPQCTSRSFFWRICVPFYLSHCFLIAIARIISYSVFCVCVLHFKCLLRWSSTGPISRVLWCLYASRGEVLLLRYDKFYDSYTTVYYAEILKLFEETANGIFLSIHVQVFMLVLVLHTLFFFLFVWMVKPPLSLAFFDNSCSFLASMTKLHFYQSKREKRKSIRGCKQKNCEVVWRIKNV